jgi:hypothetical protein
MPKAIFKKRVSIFEKKSYSHRPPVYFLHSLSVYIPKTVSAIHLQRCLLANFPRKFDFSTCPPLINWTQNINDEK